MPAKNVAGIVVNQWARMGTGIVKVAALICRNSQPVPGVLQIEKFCILDLNCFYGMNVSVSSKNKS